MCESAQGRGTYTCQQWTTDFCMSVHEDMDKGFLHMCLSVCVQFTEVHGMSGANSSSVDKGGYVYMCELGTI